MTTPARIRCDKCSLCYKDGSMWFCTGVDGNPKRVDDIRNEDCPVENTSY